MSTLDSAPDLSLATMYIEHLFHHFRSFLRFGWFRNWSNVRIPIPNKWMPKRSSSIERNTSNPIGITGAHRSKKTIDEGLDFFFIDLSSVFFFLRFVCSGATRPTTGRCGAAWSRGCTCAAPTRRCSRRWRAAASAASKSCRSGAASVTSSPVKPKKKTSHHSNWATQ